MDYKTYYLNQAGNGYPVYIGTPYQKGYGLGGVFRKFFKWVLPILKEHALPIVKTVGKEVLRGASNIANDKLNGKNLKESAKARIKESLNSLAESVQSGEGYKRKQKQNKIKKLISIKKFSKKKKRFLDIFDKNVKKN